MMKSFRSLAPGLLGAILVVLSAAVLAACGGNGEPERVALAEVVADQDAYHGDTIRLRGTVVGFDVPVEHYVIEDANQNRVELVPTDQAARYEGQEITVLGRFTFEEGQGRRIEIEEVTVHN